MDPLIFSLLSDISTKRTKNNYFYFFFYNLIIDKVTGEVFATKLLKKVLRLHIFFYYDQYHPQCGKSMESVDE